MFSVAREGVRDKGFKVVDAATQVLNRRVGGNHSVKDRADDGKGCGLTARHFSNVGRSRDGEVLGRNPNKFQS